MAAIKGQPSPRPSDLPPAIPRPEQMSDEELILAAQSSGIKPPEQMSDEELIAALNAQGGGVGSAGEIAAAQSGYSPEGARSEILDIGGRVADYAGGMVRTGVAAAAGVAGEEDWKAAAVGKAPGSAQYMERAGVEEGASIYMPGFGRVSQRDVSGLALDIASDPATALAKLTREVPIMTKFLRKKSPILDTIAAVIANPGGTVANQIGEDMYRSSFRKLGEKIGKERANSVSNRLIDEGKGSGFNPLSESSNPKGAPISGAAVGEAAERMSADMGNIRQGFYDYADQLGVSIDLAKPGTFSRSEQLLNKWMKTADPALETLVGDLHDLLDTYKARGAASVADVSSFKTQLYHGLPKSAFQDNKIIAVADQFKKALAGDMRRSIVRAAEGGERGLGRSIDALNESWGPILEAKGPLAKAAVVEGRSSALGAQIDAMAVMSGNIAPAMARKAMEIAQTPYGRRMIGKALMRAGSSGWVDAMTRRSLANRRGAAPSPLMNEEEE